jgi:hypothetical protein
MKRRRNAVRTSKNGLLTYSAYIRWGSTVRHRQTSQVPPGSGGKFLISIGRSSVYLRWGSTVRHRQTSQASLGSWGKVPYLDWKKFCVSSLGYRASLPNFSSFFGKLREGSLSRLEEGLYIFAGVPCVTAKLRRFLEEAGESSLSRLEEAETYIRVRQRPSQQE